jgi:hypothetical protein
MQSEERKNKQIFDAARKNDVALARALHSDNRCRLGMINDKKYAHLSKEVFAAAYETLHMTRDMPDSELQAMLRADTDARYEEYHRLMTPIDVAAEYGHVRMVDFLSRHHRHLGIGLLFAVHLEHEIVARILVERRIHDTENDSVCYQNFVAAVAGGNTRMVQIFLHDKCTLNPNPGNHRRPMRSVFHVAASRGHEAVLKQLMEYEYANLDFVDEVARLYECIAVLEPIMSKHIINTVLQYKGVEKVCSQERLSDFVLPSMEFKDCEGLTALEYAQQRLDNADEDQEQHAKLAACVDLLHNQQAEFMNFCVKKYYNPFLQS